MGFNLDRRLFDVLQCMPTVPGAVGAFRRRALADVGGVSGATLAEDTDLTLAIGRAGWRVVYAEDARAWTEAPATLRGALATALPLVLRNDPVGLEAPGCDLAARRGTDRPARPAVSHPLPDRAAAARAADRPLLDLRVPLPQPGWRARLLGRLHDAFNSRWAGTRSGSTGNPPGCSGRCRSSSSSTASSCTWSSSSRCARRFEGIQAPLAPDRAQRRDRSRRS